MARATKVDSEKASSLRFTATSIEHRPLDQVLPYSRNARTHSDDQVAQIAASIKEFGFVNPILVGPDKIRLTAVARSLNFLTSVTPGRLFQISTRHSSSPLQTSNRVPVVLEQP